MHFQHLTVQKEEDGLAWITINRPDALNALNSEVLAELSMVVAEFEIDEDVAVVLLTGAGKAFIAGADIRGMLDMDTLEAQRFSEMGGSLAQSMEESTKPYIAVVNGFALGGGCELALACDFIYASSKAKFGQPEVKLGVIPGFGGTQRLARRVGVAKAKELIFTGELVVADEAFDLGLVDKVVDPDSLVDVARATAQAIRKNSLKAVAAAKRVIHEGQSMTLEQGNRLEQLAFASLFSGPDQSEGMTAFLQKRPASF